MKPALLLLSIVLLSACGGSSSREGQKQPLPSPSGDYTLEMPIRKSNRLIDFPVWTPTIKDKNGKIIYTDEASTLSGYHKSYWDWGVIPETGSDILWIYNSDDGQVITFSLAYGKWIKTVRDLKKMKLVPPDIIENKLTRYQKPPK